MPRHITKRQIVTNLISEIQNNINRNNVDVAIPLLNWTKEKIDLTYNEYLRHKRYLDSRKTDGKPRHVKRGTIYYAKLGKNIGSEQNGYRPVLVVQQSKANATSPTVIIIPLTDALDNNGVPKKVLDTHVEIDHPDLTMKSLIKTEYVRSISKNRLLNEICTIDNIKMLEVENKIKLSLGIR